MGVDAGYYLDLLRPLVAGRRVILFGVPAAAWTSTVRLLRDLGSERCLLVASGPGSGPQPSPDDADRVDVEVTGTNPVELFRSWEQVMAAPPAAVVDAVERYDPDRDALVLAAPVQALYGLVGRPAWGARRPEWVALEDKVLLDPILEAAGVARAPHEVVPADRDALLAAAARLDRGDGTVWSGDTREGFNGGAVFVRWVRPGDDDRAAEAAAFLSARCDAVRVMPFLEGVPCSVHGIVVGDTVVALRPVEMVVLRSPEAAFRYAGAATFWDPPDDDRAAMRDVARRVGAELRRRAGYAGSFTVDGVLTADGFLPTEVNPRFGAGMATLQRGLEDVPLTLLHFAVTAGEPLDYRPDALEALVLDGVDANRSGGGWLMVDRAYDETEENPLVAADGGFRLANGDEERDGTLLLGPGERGGFVRFTPEPRRTAVGDPVAPLVASAFALADRRFGAGIGPLEPARRVR